MIKEIYKNLELPIIFNAKRMNAFSLRSGERQGYSLHHSKAVLEILASEMKQEKRNTINSDQKLSSKTFFIHR